jgi:hypothetical protein
VDRATDCTIEVFVNAEVEAEVQVEEVEAEVSRRRGSKEGASRRVHVVARSRVRTFPAMEEQRRGLGGHRDSIRKELWWSSKT